VKHVSRRIRLPTFKVSELYVDFKSVYVEFQNEFRPKRRKKCQKI